MANVKDFLVDWYMRNIFIPGSVKFENPGFIFDAFTQQNQNVGLREFLLPEALFADMEKRIIQAEGQKGAQALYSAGKKFAYSDAQVSGMPNIKTSSRKKFEEGIYLLVRVMGNAFADGIDYTMDVDHKQVEIFGKNFFICGKNGYGYILPSGSIAGYISYMFDDPKMECLQVKCCGRGDDSCRFIALSSAVSTWEKPFTETNVAPFRWSDGRYNVMNAVRPTTYCRRSLEDFLHTGIVTCNQAHMSFYGEPFAFIGSHIVYNLENELSDKGKSLLFDAAFDFGFDFAHKHFGGSPRFAMEALSAMGFGDVFISGEQGKPTLAINYYPWMPGFDKCEFTYIRGLASGMLSQIGGKEIRFTKAQATTVNGFLGLTLR